MADETLKWRLLLQDRVSPGAKSARDALKAFRGELARAGRDAARAQAQNARRMAENQRLIAAGTRQGLGLLGGLAVGAVGAIGSIVSAFGGMGLAAAQGVVEIAAFRESSLAALETVMGSSEAARRSFSNAMVMANQTPADTADVVAQYQRYAVAGFAEREIAPLVAATADIGAAFGATASDSFALVTSQMRAAGKMDRGDLRQLLNSGVNTGEVLDSVARQIGIRNTDERARRQAVLAAISHGRVTGEVGIQAALDATRNRLDRGSALGTFARRQSETLTGALSNARNAVFNLLAGMDFANIPGVRAFKDTVLAITAALANGTPAAAMLRGAVTSAANSVGNLFGRIFTVQNAMAGLGIASRAFGAIGRFATAAWPVVRAFVGALGPGFMAGIAPLRAMFSSIATGGGPSAQTMALITASARGMGAAFGFIAGSVLTFTAAIGAFAVGVTGLWATFTGAVSGGFLAVRAAFVNIGGQIVDGIRDGITGGVGRLGASVAGLGTSAVQAARNALGIRSPSRVFADVIGAQIPAGIELGIRQGSGPLDATVAGIVDPRPPRGGLGGGANVTVYITVQRGAGDEDTARAIRGQLHEELLDIFGGMAEQLG